MKLTIAFMAAAGALAASPPRLGEPTRDDFAAIDQCVRDAKDDPSACIGRVEKPCQDTEAGQTTAGAMFCAQRETGVWTARAKTAADAISAKLNPGRLKLFQAADAAWANYRSAACAYEASIYEGGSLAKVVVADCMLRETATRALDLEDDAKDGDGGE